MSLDPRAPGRELRAAALEVHRVLVEIGRLAHEREHGRVERPAERLEGALARRIDQ